ncbi:extracellular solute-binding protein [Paenibacillus campinasensis]|uniref:ABC transporter substrate-binding protein n=1 Tax=Paenibacillus campinasensis TaxID=66347 RepID=A0A268ETT9_9BACL|nr:extracellular solute-binding protein [Paenibacillus campinasensis]MUG67081.1 extracellular solute-binding protein [Paenibacillus campinasensis]PAD76494.1 ABC transporter substrate-binding protein [Paenibacillus campinasensis]
MKKRMVALVSIVTAVSIMAGCQSSSSTSANEPTKLVIAARGGTHVTAMEAVKETFEQEHNAQIEILGLEAADLKQKVSLDSTSKNGAYDLIMADDPWMPEFGEAGIFANLSELGVEADADFEESSLALGKHPYETGDLYALPFAGNVQLFFYNKELLDKHSLSVPQTWEEVVNAANTIQASGDGAGYVIRGQQGNPIVSDFLPIFWAHGGQVFDDNWNAQLDSEAGRKALDTYINLLAAGVNYEQTDIVSSVSEGRAAMALGWPSWFISEGKASANYAPIPSKASASDAEASTGMIGNWMMGVAANSENKELAAKFLTFITSSESQKVMAQHGGVPTRKSVYLDSELSAKFEHFPVQLEALQNSVARPRTTKWSLVEEALGAELSAAIAGTKSIEDALASANHAINQIMQ